MPNQEEIIREFERIRQMDIEAYEAEVKKNKESEERLLHRKKIISDHLAVVAEEYRVDLKKLHTIHDREEGDLEEFLKDVRPTLLARTSAISTDLRQKAMYVPALDQAGVENAEFLGMYLLAPDVKNFEGIEGEIGNPWLSPTNTDRIRLGQTYKGSGSGCFSGYIYSPDIACVFYSYVPQKTGILHIQAWSILHGFYIAVANDTCFTCKMAKAYAHLEMSTCQNNIWQHGDDFVVCDIDDDNVYKYGFIDKKLLLNIARPVLSKMPLYIRVRFAIGTLAKGGGSYAEVNFKEKAKDGSDLHYVWIPCVVVQYQ